MRRSVFRRSQAPRGWAGLGVHRSDLAKRTEHGQALDRLHRRRRRRRNGAAAGPRRKSLHRLVHPHRSYRGMSYSPVQSDDVHVGRDANDTTWLVVRYRDDWARAVLDGLYFDPLASRLELAVQLSSSHHDEPICAARVPLSASAPSASAVPQTVTLSQIWLPLAPVTDESGDQYRSDPVADVVLRRRACGGEFTPLPCFGGHGWETGRLDHPIGLALDARGLLYVADACNHRVQVVRPADGSVVIVLGRVDGYGRPVVGVDHGAMTEPVDVAVDACRCRLYVPDRLVAGIH